MGELGRNRVWTWANLDVGELGCGRTWTWASFDVGEYERW